MAPVAITVLTEDSSRDGQATVLRFVKHAALLACPTCQTQKLDPEPTEQALQKGAISANRWRSRRPEDHAKIVDLIRYLATRLAMSRSLVFYHVDGDVPWAGRDDCKNVDDFRRIVIEKVRKILASPVRSHDVARTPEQIDECLERLIPIIPFYSIEAWLYQNTTKLREFCKKKCRSRHVKHDRVFSEWEREPACLEELEQPKDKCCQGSARNLELATSSFPWPKLEGVNKSFNAFVDKLRGNPRVIEILLATGQ